MCAILSDTVIFKSPTCTTADIKCVEALAEIAGIEDPKALGMEMFEVFAFSLIRPPLHQRNHANAWNLSIFNDYGASRAPDSIEEIQKMFGDLYFQ